MNRQMLEAFHLEGVKRIVFIGSAVIYQAFEGSITEGELDFNQDPYPAYFGFAWAMRFLEKLCAYLHEQHGHEVIMIRAANIFGPRDKFDVERSNFIPAIIRKAADKMDPFELWGTPSNLDRRYGFIVVAMLKYIPFYLHRWVNPRYNRQL